MTNVWTARRQDDPALLAWLSNAFKHGDAFLSSIARAGMVADAEQYPMVRPLIMELRRKYPKYEPTDQVKEEIRERIP